MKIKPTPVTSFTSGIYQATDRICVVAYHGLDFSIRPGDGILMFFEAAWNPTLGAAPAVHEKDGKGNTSPADPGLQGTYKLGGYYSNFPLVSGTSDAVEDNTFRHPDLSGSKAWGRGKEMNWIAGKGVVG